MNKFFKRNSDGKEFRVYKKISNGTILTKFDEKTGTPYGNDEYQEFFSKSELNLFFTPFEFKLESTEAMNRIVAKALGEVAYQLNNYGIAEEAVRNFRDFEGHSPNSCSVLYDMVKDDKAEFKDFFGHEDDEFEYSQAEEIFYFLKDGLSPILKKMLIEAGKD